MDQVASVCSAVPQSHKSPKSAACDTADKAVLAAARRPAAAAAAVSVAQYCSGGDTCRAAYNGED